MSRKYVYGTNVITQPAELSIEEVKDALTEFFPELENATHTVDEEGTVTFSIRAANKGSDRRKYVYGANVIEQPAELSIEEVKEALSEFFPELENAVHTVDEEGTVTFSIRAANKGADRRKYVYGTNVIEQPADLSVEEVQEALAEFFPELENATYEMAEDGTVTFSIRAANKGF